MTTRLIFARDVWDQLHHHLKTQSPSEDGAFLLLNFGFGTKADRLIAPSLLLPPADAWEGRGNHNLRPSGQWLSAAIGEAIEAGCGLAFVHSHPAGDHPSELSRVDKATSREWARMVVPTLGRPFASLVWTPDDISGWVFLDRDAEPTEIDGFEALGHRQRIVLRAATARGRSDADLDDRQVRALGDLGNSRLRDLSVAIVGAGGTGSPLAEILARMGVARLVVIDPDVIDTASNLRRITGSTADDLRKGAAKAAVVARHITALHLVKTVDGIAGDVRDADIARVLLDVDLVVSTTDTHSSRAFLNQLALQYYVPVVDVGVRVGTAIDGTVSGMPVDVRLILPDEPCLWCRGVLDAERIRVENLPDAERNRLEAEGYVQGIGVPQPSLAALNYVAAAMTATIVLQLSTDNAVSAGSFIVDPWELYLQPMDAVVDHGCLCRLWRGRGDSVALRTL
jgi:molybdopterin/thiamine biosynthesis adenylyltransferase